RFRSGRVGHLRGHEVWGVAGTRAAKPAHADIVNATAGRDNPGGPRFHASRRAATHPPASTSTPHPSVAAPCASSSSRYHRVAASRRGSWPATPQTTDSVRTVSGRVLVRCESRTALAHGPSASKRQTRPDKSISWPDRL